jgi:hypothetical protein
MTLALRRAATDDYDVTQAGEIVGRIYRMKADRELWRWMIPGLRAPTDVATTLDEAKAAFRAAWEAGGRLSLKKADEKWLSPSPSVDDPLRKSWLWLLPLDPVRQHKGSFAWTLPCDLSFSSKALRTSLCSRPMKHLIFWGAT